LSLTVRQLAEWVGGEVVGDPNTPLRRPAALNDAEPGDFTFVTDGDKNVKAWAASKAAAAVVPLAFPADDRPVVKVADPLAAFLGVVLRLRGDRTQPREIHPTAVLHPTVQLGPGARVEAYAVIGEGTTLGANATVHTGGVVGRFCTIGDDFTLHPHAVLYDDCVVGHRVTVHANAVVGGDGFGYRLVKGRHEKIPQLGSVELEDDVEIGSGSTVDRGAIGPTRVGAGTKIDNLVMVAHNCRLGRHNILVGQAGLAGSVRTGDYVVIAGQAGIADHIRIGDRTVIGAQSGVLGDIPPDTEVLGSPAFPRRDYLRTILGIQKLAELRDEVKDLKKRVKELEARG
jgi:UDP-3-O-[3-hydroxymyristoyl] glucosamine N-acyltransferase